MNRFNKVKVKQIVHKVVPENPKIPLDIYQFWHDDNLPDCLITATNNIKSNNPEFNYHLYNTKTARDFIEENFDSNILNAYDSVVPNAIKCDLFRYCMMYLRGGIYLDIKYMCINGFKLILLTDNGYLCRDVPTSGTGIYNAIMVCIPKTAFMLNVINKCVHNIHTKFYGSHGLEPTGPILLKQVHDKMYNYNIDNLALHLNCQYDKNNNIVIFITYYGIPILLFNKEYTNINRRVNKHWAVHYNERTFYK
jgi:mannosyltransferase OCH1-like enzyme